MKAVKTLALFVLVVATWVTAQAVQSQPAQKRYPPLYPREGAKVMYEDARVIVYDDVQTTEHQMHRHTRDSIWFYIEDGPIENLDENGKVTSTGGGTPSQTGPRFGGFTPAGRGPHSERALDPNHRRRLFRVEFKGTETADCRQWSTDPVCNK